MTVLAHIGHWYHAILYLVPVLIVAGGLWLAGKRMPDEDEFDDLEGLEVEIRPARPPLSGPRAHHDHGHAHAHAHAAHHPHVAVVRRPVLDGLVASLVFGEVVEGSYVLAVKDTDDICMHVEVRGGEVTQATWSPRSASREAVG